MVNLLKNGTVYLDPNKKKADIGEVLVGLGNTQSENEGVVLQHKTEFVRYDSLSQYVYKKSFSNVDAENCCNAIYLEDFSVDTTLSLWIFMQKIYNKVLPDNLSIWVNYANRWEKGDTSSTGKPFESYGCLQNALALNSNTKTTTEILFSSLSFLDHLIKNSIDPACIPDTVETVQYLEANYRLKKEYEKYEGIVSKSETTILYIPGKDNESVKVSAIFIETEIVSSIQKVFLRNDTNSPTGDGYALMAVHNASAKGTGNDIVISVDPGKGIQMKVLWQALEKEEDKLWNGMRPKDNPRMLSSYPNNNGPNEPWWDDMGKYTLIAAPKMVANEYGRRVSWKTVKQLIKQLYAKGTQL